MTAPTAHARHLHPGGMGQLILFQDFHFPVVHSFFIGTQEGFAPYVPFTFLSVRQHSYFAFGFTTHIYMREVLWPGFSHFQ